MEKGPNSDGLNTEEFVSGLNWHAHGQDKEREAVKPKVVDEVDLQDLIRKAPNSCSKCFELISGDTPRSVCVTVKLASVGAESSDCTITAICESCSNVGMQDAAAKDPVNSDWKRNLKPRQLEIWNRCKESNETQNSVARSLRVSQGEISKTLGACAKVRDGYLANSQPVE
jgi:hypothetical protein